MPIEPAPNVIIANRFRLNRLVGRGGMGSVWYATHLGLDIPCAVKFIEGEGAALPEVQARFEREAKAAAQLRSPHVVQILDHGLCEGTPYIAMELLDGEDLGKRLARLGRLPPHELLPIVTQVCRALTKAHAQGIVHRDLKPDNIFIVRDDDREIAKVLDFGIAKAAGSGAPGASTRTGAMLGTPYYMSPEQAQGTRAVDFRSDLWALAVIAFEALTGLRPFESEALGDLLMKIIIAPVPLPSQVVRDLPAGFDAWWMRASQRDPALRYQSAKELCDSLAMVFGRSGADIGSPSAQLNVPPTGGVMPPPMGLTPQPRVAAVSTGAPIAQTFGSGPALPKRRTGVVLTVTGALLALGAVIAVLSAVVRGKGEVVAGPSRVESTSPGNNAAPDNNALPDAMAREAPVPPQAVLTRLPDPVPPSARPLAAEPLATTPPGVSTHTPAESRPRVPTVTKPPPPARAPAPPSATAEEKKAIDLGI